MTTTLTDEKERLRIRREFHEWRRKTGAKTNASGKPLSYRQITEAVNKKAGDGVLLYTTVVSWGVRGNVPGRQIIKDLRAAFPECPLLKYAEA